MNRHLWPGLNTVEVKAANRSTEIVNQIKITSSVLSKNSVGAIHYSVAGLTNNSEMIPALKNGPYKEKALIPLSPWMKTNKIAMPNLTVNNDNSSIKIDWSSSKLNDVFQWVLYMRYDNEWEIEILPKNQLTKNIARSKNGKNCNTVALKAIDRLGNESDYAAKKI